jgi:hypothetical protein
VTPALDPLAAGQPARHLLGMYVVTEADATAIREAYETGGELSAAVELRRRFPGIIDNAAAREPARRIAAWTPLPARPEGQGQWVVSPWPKWPPTDVLAVSCSRCERAGRYPLVTLIEQHGRIFTVPDLLGELSKGCPKYDLCASCCAELPALFTAEARPLSSLA